MKNKLLYSSVFVLVLLALLALPLAFGEDVSTSVSIGTSEPEVWNIYFTPTVQIDLSSCGNVTVWCNATVMDANGWNDIQTVNATFWAESETDEGSPNNNSNHYTNSSCNLNGGSGSTVQANCSFTLRYYAIPANWTCAMYATDTASLIGSNSSNVTINSLISLDAENAINFGSLSPGATSPADMNNTVTNCGNVRMDLNLSGTNLTNTSATVTNITVDRVNYNVTNYSQTYNVTMTMLSGTSTKADLNLAKRTNGASTSKTYWKISIPASIENLIYEGTVTFTAVTDS